MAKKPTKPKAEPAPLREPRVWEADAMKHAKERYLKRRHRVESKVRKDENGHVRVEQPHSDQNGWTIQQLNAFGTTSPGFLNSEVMRLINAVCPGEVREERVNAALAVLDGVQPENEVEAMLAVQMAAIADWITRRFISNTEAGTSGLGQVKSDQFQTFMKQNAAALGVIFKPGEVSALKALAADLQQANRSVTSVKLPGRSNTPQDIISAARDANVPQSWLSWALLGGAQGAAGTAVAGPWGAAAAPIAGELLGALRRSGIQKVDDIIADAMLNPGRALMLLSKAPAKPTQKDVAAFAQRYRKAVFPSVLAQIDGESEPRQ
jgi:hypothetical protein